MPSGTETNLIQELEQFLSPESASREGIGEMPRVMSRVMLEAFEAAAEAWGEAEAVATVDATVFAAVGLSASLEIVLIGVLIAILFTVLWIQGGITNPLRSVGIWGIGPKMAGLIDSAFAPIQSLQNTLIGMLQGAITRALRGFVTAVQWAMVQGFDLAVSPLEAVAGAVVAPVHREVDNLWGWVQAISNEVTALSGVATTTGVVSPGSNADVTSRLEQLEARNDRQGAEISQLNRRVATMEGELTVISRYLDNLRHTVYGTRNSMIGGQDLASQIDQLRQRVETAQAQQSATLQQHTSELAKLAPLGSLLYLGERGLGNLRTLERDMCQCPRLPRVGFITPDLLAMEQVLAHGL